MKKILALSLLGALTMTGCHKEEPAPMPTKAPTKVKPASAPEATATAPSAEPTQSAPEVTPMQQSTASGLTLLVQEYTAKTGHTPKDFNELVAAKMMAKLPVAPPGMKYMINAQNRQVIIVRDDQ